MEQPFRSANQLNIFVNYVAGHFLPLNDTNKGLGFFKRLWMIFTWSIKIVYITSVALGTLHFANLTTDQMFKRSAPITVLTTESLLPLIYLNFRRDHLRNLIQSYNNIFVDSQDLVQCVHETVTYYNKGIKFYLIAGFVCAFMFPVGPFLRIFESDQFTYADFTVPAYLPGEPFGRSGFAAGIVLQVFGGIGIHIAAIGLYLYVIHYIAVLTGQYKYLRKKVSKALSEENGAKDELSAISALQDCIRYHCAVINIGRTLNMTLAFYVGTTYISCILEFCFLAYGVITYDDAVIEKIAYAGYIFCRLLIIFMLCSSVQELVDASTSVMDDAFHEKWYASSNAVRKIFHMIQLGNQIECRISAYRIVDLIVPTLALILSKSYSICLLLLNIK